MIRTPWDFDDAVSLEEEGGYRLGCLFADVSYYVKSGVPWIGGSLHAGATSVYFPDRVIPMLRSPPFQGSAA